MAFMRMIERLCRSQTGNVGMMTALLIVPSLGLVGGASDFANLARARVELKTAVESAVLASASLTSTGDPEEIIQEYIVANVTNPELFDNLEIEVTKSDVAINKRYMTVVATSQIETNFLSLFGIDDLSLVTEASAAQSSTNVEIAMVLDISSSMKGKKLENLKKASVIFVKELVNEDTEDTTSINLVPFGGTVNLGNDLFEKFVVDDPNPGFDLDGVITDPLPLQYSIQKLVLLGSFRFSDGDSCIEYQLDDFDTGLLPNDSRSQVPHFWKWNNFQPWCPEDESSILLNTNDVDALEDRIEEMTLSDGTGMDIGALWGLWSLSPDWRGTLGGTYSDRPADFTDIDTKKVAVLMSDGGITNQARPKDYKYYSTHDRPWPHNKNRGNVGNSYRDDNDQQITKAGNKNHDLHDDSAIGRFNHVCDELKSNGVIVYTIGFQIKKGSNEDTYLKNCATSPNYYFFVEGLNIGDAFSAIAASVSALRITG